MQKSFPLFLRQLYLCREFFKESDVLKSLTQDDFEELKNLGLLKRGSDSTHVICESCDDPHHIPVKCEGEKPYTSCVRDSARNYLEPHEIRTWVLDVRSFLQGMTARLGINEQIELLEIEGLWHLGVRTKDGIPHTCYFYHGKKFEDVSELLGNQRAGTERQIVISSKKGLSTKVGEQGISTLDVGLLVELKEGNLKFNKRIFDQYLNAFRGVQFDLKSGNLSVNGESIVTIAFNTPQYHFAAFLWEKFSEPMSNDKIRQHVSKKRRYNYDRDSNQVCYDLKNKIKALAKDDERKQKLLDTIFVTSPTQGSNNGFMMQNPT